MDYFHRIAMESLEDRTLFFITVTFPHPTPTVLHDIQQIQTDVNLLNQDRSSGIQLILQDRRQLVADRILQKANVSAANEQLRTDTRTGKLALLADRANELRKRTLDRNAIITDNLQIVLDHADPVALSADGTKLSADRAALNADISDGQAKFNSDKAAFLALWVNDRSAILATRISDSPAVAFDKTKIITDVFNLRQTLFNDQQTIFTDRLQLRTDRLEGK